MGKGYKGKNPRGAKREQVRCDLLINSLGIPNMDPSQNQDAEAEAEWQAKQRGGGQSSNVGMLPPSDSEEEEDGAEAAPKQPIREYHAKPLEGQPANVGELPPSDSEGSEDDESSDDEPEYFKQTVPKKKDVEPVERSAEDIRKEMERLEIIRKKREDDRKKRIEREGWDRFAPVSETNRPPGRSAPES